MKCGNFFNSFNNLINNKKNVVIVTHVNPDGDAIGSSLALWHILRKKGLDPIVVIPNEYPSFLAWIPGADRIFVFDKDVDGGTALLKNADLICVLDFNNPSRAGLVHNALCAAKCPKVLIDHHMDANIANFAACMSRMDISSTSELVANLAFDFGFDEFVDQNVADCLLAGIMTDTGSFAHSVYSGDVFEVCSRLVTKSSNYTEIHQRIYSTFTENRLRLLGFAISNRMVVLDEYATAFIVLDKKDLNVFNYHIGDTEGIVNYPLTLDGIVMSVLITERQEGTIRLSFRSKGDFSVHELAKKHFNGGGHTNAAGGTMQDTTTEHVVDVLKQVLPEYKNSLLSER